MKSGCFWVSAKSECVSTYILWPNYMPKTDGRATVIGNENVYTTSDYRTSSNKLDLFADPQRMTLSWRAITQSCIENTNVSSLQCFWIAHFEKFEMCEVKQRATVQDSCLSNTTSEGMTCSSIHETMKRVIPLWMAAAFEVHILQQEVIFPPLYRTRLLIFDFWRMKES